MYNERNTAEPLRIYGTVEHITFRNPDNGFTVMEILCEGDPLTVVAVTADIAPGEELELTGRYDTHATYGRQFRADRVIRTMPSGAAAILKYLSAGAVRGIGPATARRLVERFGDQTLEVLGSDPDRVAEVKGITRSKAREISAEFKKRAGFQEVMLYLSKFDVSPEEAMRAYKTYGKAACDIIGSNPYALCAEGIRFSFERADAIAEQAGLGAENPHRIMAGIEYILRHNLGNGHTCLPRGKLMSVAKALLGADGDLIEDYCDELIETKRLICEAFEGEEFLFLPEWHRAEYFAAARLAVMLGFPPGGASAAAEDIDRTEAELGIRYAERQREAILAALQKGVLILTGGPGTGKTTTLNAIIRLMQRRGLEVALAAPTGRAAKRMSEVTGCEAKTIHRLLEAEWGAGDLLTFARNERNPLDVDAVVVDELSMVDAGIFEHLLRAMRLGCRLIMVGDSDQLPSVGAGNVLHDLIDSGVVPSVRLDEVFRQAMESLIVTNAHDIVAGRMPVLDSNTADFFMLREERPYLAAEKVVDLCARRLPAAYGYSPIGDIQVLCPSRKMELGSISLNNALQARLNPSGREKAEVKHRGFILREGDKVMQIKNNYDIAWTRDDGEIGSGVFNGDVGILEVVSASAGSLSVRFEDRVAVYTGEELDQLELAYAVTIHKAQGSEFPCVILPVLDVPSKLRYRNLLYTGVTRAKERLVLVGSPAVVAEMVENNRRSLRYTGLSPLLVAAVGEGEASLPSAAEKDPPEGTYRKRKAGAQNLF